MGIMGIMGIMELWRYGKYRDYGNYLDYGDFACVETFCYFFESLFPGRHARMYVCWFSNEKHCFLIF